jgi:hypothetical protein
MSDPHSSLCLESQSSKLKLAEQIGGALALLRDAIEPDGVARADYPMDENEFFKDGAGI